MIEGVVCVYADESRELQLFAPPGDSFEFFSDMHRYEIEVIRGREEGCMIWTG